MLLEHLADGVLHGVAKLPELEALKGQRQDQAAANDQDQSRDAPYDAVDDAVYVRDSAPNIFHTLSPS